MNLIIENLGGFCPVQASGTINGKPFYFRARGHRWQMAIDEEGDDPVGVLLKGGTVWTEEWGEGFEAGYMPLDEAQKLIQQCAEKYENQ